VGKVIHQISICGASHIGLDPPDIFSHGINLSNTGVSKMRLGFIGTGVITEAIIVGLLQSDFDVTELVVSKRNQAISARLATRSDKVRISDDNQAIVEASDLLFLAVRPQNAHAVLSPLRFTDQQRVCSLIATLTAETLQDWIGSPARIFRSIPLPSVAERRGVTALFPHDDLGQKVFSQLGTVVSARTIDEFDALATASAMMGTYFGILDTVAEWLATNGIERENAQNYLNGVFLGLARTSTESGAKNFETLRVDHSTPGGLNEQMFDVFASSGGTDALNKALDGVVHRVRDARKEG